jgi:predicted DsbA family dithiol-disulfide isomerase
MRQPLNEQVEVYADVLCPFAHVGLRRFVARRDETATALSLRVRSWPLELVNGEPLAVTTVAQKVAALRRSVGRDLFAGFDPTSWPATSLPALQLEASAYLVGIDAGERMSVLLRDALFEHGEDISDPSVLDRLAAVAGIPAAGPDAPQLVESDWLRGRERGVIGSPHFFVEGADFFCPSLEIRHVDGELDIAFDASRFDAFFERCRSLAA